MKLSQDKLDRMNASYARRTEEDGLPVTIIDAMWMEQWLGPCPDPDCPAAHHWELCCAIIRNGPDDMPVARILVSEDKNAEQVNLSRGQLNTFISNLTALLEELP